MMRTSNGQFQTRAFRDIGLYGTYAADMQYRQERIDGEVSQRNAIIPRAFREWFGTALIRLGTRIDEGGRICAERRMDRQRMTSPWIAPRQ